ncbi:MAG TPA: trypsin-like peptidase domain-containing protein [Acidimicrobiales bacterium]|nr:trypsin-like peptidase domain-containing protein [Acidimicrobiales bacterium]
MPGVLEELERATVEVAERIGPAVVGIGQGWGQGSGVVVADGVVLTNAHNVSDPGVTVIFADGRTVTGQVSGHDIDADLATVAVDTAGIAPVEWGESPARVGAAVFALANPGGRGLRVTLGTVASVGRSFRGPRGRRVTGTVEHTAAMAKGSSGGPLVDAAGRLVGINTNRLGEGFYAALPADEELRRRVDALSRGQSPVRPRLGVGLVPGRAARHIRRAAGLPDRDGVLIQEVEEGSPAANAGLRRGDLVVEAGGSPVKTIDDLYQAVDDLAPGASLALGVVRGAEELSVSVTFGGGGTREEGTA